MREATASVVKSADRLINSARVLSQGIEITFADGRSGVIPFDDIRGIDQELLSGIELPSQHELILRATTGESVDIPWDFARHYSTATPHIKSNLRPPRHAAEAAWGNVSAISANRRA